MQPRLVNGAQSASLANVHGPPETIQPPSTFFARPREAGKWLEPATRGSDPVRAVDLLDDARAHAGREPVRRGSRPHGPAGRAVPLRDLGDDVELLAHRELVAAVLGGAADVERARRVQVGDRLVGVAARALGLERALAQGGSESADVLEDRREPARP